MSEIIITPEKKKKIEDLVKSLKALDDAMLPFREQRKELKSEYVENAWLTKDEVKMVGKAYNAVKNKIDLEDLSQFADICKGLV